MIKLLIPFLFMGNAFAFTLNTNINANFDKKEVKIYVTSNSSCSNAGISNTELLSIAIDAANKFWNKVPSSYLRLKEGGIYKTTDTKFLSGILCVTDSDTSCDSATSIPKVDDIIITCNSDTTKNFTSSSYYALSVPNHFSSKKIKGSVIIINDSTNTQFDKLSREEMVNVLGHELGHALGLGHTKDKAALMYYSEFSSRHRLGQDDIDGITYLYPNKLHGCSGIFGTINTIGSNDDFMPPGTLSFLTQLVFGMLAIWGLLIFTKNITYLLVKYRQKVGSQDKSIL